MPLRNALLFALILLLSACTAKATKPIQLNDPWASSKGRLEASDAVEAPLAMAAPNPKTELYNYELKDGRLLTVLVKDNAIVGLEVCSKEDAEKSKAERAWTKVNQLSP